MVVDGAGLCKFPLDAKVAHSAIRKEPGCLLLLSTAILKLSSPDIYQICERGLMIL